MERIAATAGVNKQLLFHYFASKAGLHRAAVYAILGRYSLDVPASGPPADRLRDLIEQLLSASDSNPALLSVLAGSSPTASDPAESVGLARDWSSRALRAAAQVIQDGQRTGYVRDDVDPERVAEVLVAASLGRAATGERGKQSQTSEHGDQFREVLLKMALDYCTWR
jgi:AcrR family transcriptional regulator